MRLIQYFHSFTPPPTATVCSTALAGSYPQYFSLSEFNLEHSTPPLSRLRGTLSSTTITVKLPQVNNPCNYLFYNNLRISIPYRRSVSNNFLTQFSTMTCARKTNPASSRHSCTLHGLSTTYPHRMRPSSPRRTLMLAKDHVKSKKGCGVLPSFTALLPDDPQILFRSCDSRPNLLAASVCHGPVICRFHNLFR